MDNAYVILSDISKRQVLFRRIILFGLVLVSVVFATLKWADFMPTDLAFVIRYGLLFLFCVTFGWIALFFWSSLFGFFELLTSAKPIVLIFILTLKLNKNIFAIKRHCIL